VIAANPDTKLMTSSTSGYGRGMLLLAMANAAYIVTAYAVTTITARLLDPADFGSFGVVMAWITVLTALLVKGLATVTAREMATGDAPTAWHAGLALGMRLSLALAIVGVAVSPFASDLFGASGLAEEFAVGALAAITFGTNAVLLAWPTGQRIYGRQAIAQVAYAIARVVLVVGGAWTAGLWGAVVGYVLAPLLASVSLITRVPAGTGDTRALRRAMARAVLPVSIVSIAVTAYFVVDIFVLSAIEGGSSEQVGIYVAYGTVAHVPFFLLQAASIAIVPALAGAAAGASRHLAIRRTMTDVLVLLAGPTLLLSFAGDAAARVIFGGEYRADGIVLPLALATGAVTLIANLVAIDVAIGRLRTGLAITLGGVVLVIVLAWGSAASNPAQDVAAAVLLGCAITLVGQAAHVRVKHGALLHVARASTGMTVAFLAALPVLFVEDDLARTLLAALCGVLWLAIVVKLRLVDVRRGSVTPADAEHA
jgi:O-antigen/teichoic acid export membrane protein